ncbi:MAG: TonB-dependent receptor [Bacteroidales bacterium]|nr:TonB-dependent receptor [Bacteroidales bacterium]
MLLNKWKFAKVLLLLPMLFFSFSAFAQKSVSGTVTAASDGQPLPGVNVLVQGTTQGTITDFDGKYQLSVSEGQTLVFTFVGFTNQNVVVGGQNVYDVILEEETSDLDEVVVVGYGVQKKKLVTGATVQVKGDDLQKLSTTSALTAMQSQTPGVVIQQNSGQAGDGFKVNIRGLGTVGNSAPLYVIDGVAGGDINNLNPSDIESIDVLKDAASSAIYGARAANGVILVTTKKGSNNGAKSKVTLSYDGYVGAQYMYKASDACNAQDYIYSRKLRDQFAGQYSEPDWKGQLPEDIYNSLFDEEGNVRKDGWKGTNWIEESYKKGAITQNHAFNLSGGNDVSVFSIGYSYTQQDGILGGKTPSEYDRHTARINSDHNVIKSSDGSFNVLTIGETFNYSRNTKRGISQGNMYWNNIKSLMTANPLFPVYDKEGNLYTNPEANADGWKLDGSSQANPIAQAATTGHGLNQSYSWNISLSAYASVQPIKGLIYKSQFGYRMGTSTYRSMTAKHDTGSDVAVVDGVSQSSDVWSNMTFENTLSYNFDVNENNFDIVLGQAIEQNKYGQHLDAAAKNLLFGSSWKHAWISNTEKLDISELSMNGNPSSDSSLASFFGRLSWNYAEKYMAQFTLRADGSSNFARGNRWGYFPSGSLGWVMSQESFMDGLKGTVDFLKIRGSWGQNGNCSISNFQYVTQVGFDEKNAYYLGGTEAGGTNNSTPTTGGYFKTLMNPDISWETSQQIDLGIDARFLDSRLSLAFDWYKKTTKDWLVVAPILGVYGIGAPYINGGDVDNKGIELSLGWNDETTFGLSYGVTANVSYNKNEVTKLANSEGILHGPSAVLHQLEGEVYRAQVGEPIGFFYGFKTDGIFQNQTEIEEFRAQYTDKMHGNDKLKPGDVRYVDVTGDNIIDDRDRTNIGDPHPDVTAGLTITLGYKGFDFALTGAGAFGQQILRPWANQDFSLQNPTKAMVYKSWKGEGTSNKLPRFDAMDNINWKTMSQIHLEDADYFKIQNITLGYNFNSIWKSNNPFSQVRLYVTAQNIYTFTKYTGMDPEVGMEGGSGNSWASGIDTGAYPSARTYMVGLNIKL